jgi:predicted kinase
LASEGDGVELILFCGLQACGKSTFYQRRFADTHLRVSMDMLRTRHREQILLSACLAAKQPLVVDNTNPTQEERSRYITAAKASGFRVVGFYFESKIEDCKRRNSDRPTKHVVPLRGLLGTYKRLVLPAWTEGFDQLWYVRIDDAGEFVIAEWADEVR